jgi:hypothetical protein
MKLELKALTPAAVRKMPSSTHVEKRDVMPILSPDRSER